MTIDKEIKRKTHTVDSYRKPISDEGFINLIEIYKYVSISNNRFLYYKFTKDQFEDYLEACVKYTEDIYQLDCQLILLLIVLNSRDKNEEKHFLEYFVNHLFKREKDFKPSLLLADLTDYVFFGQYFAELRKNESKKLRKKVLNMTKMFFKILKTRSKNEINIADLIEVACVETEKEEEKAVNFILEIMKSKYPILERYIKNNE